MSAIRNIIITALLSAIFSVNTGLANESTASPDSIRTMAPKVFVDCPDCDPDFLKTKITFVNYVRDRMLADIHILTSHQATASGGREYTLEFIGKREFAGMQDTLKYITGESDTEDMIRQGLANTIKRGLIRYISRTPLADYVKINCLMPTRPVEVVDKWKNWIFEIRGSLYTQGQKSYHQISLYMNISARRVTETSRFQVSLYGNYRENEYDYDDYQYLSITRDKSSELYYNRAINDHWSWALGFGAASSSYTNLDLQVYGAPMLEYNIFPYTQSTRRQLRIAYKAYFMHHDYTEETIYDKTEEWLAKHRLQVSADFIQPWGSAELSFSATHYLHDFKKNRLQLYGEMSVRVIQGLSFEIYGNISRIHDQLTLRKGGASDEDLILLRKELETSYDYYVSVGLSYSFGSIYSNIVNPRFGY